MPRWLWRHTPDEAALAGLPETGRYRRESGLREAVDRLGGVWTYHGWKGGYFDSEQDALAFYDEVRWLLRHRRASPSIARWRTDGLNWAYGLRASADESYITDYRSGAVRRADDGDSAICGAIINGMAGSPAGDGDVWDLWRREASVLQRGGASGANISDLSDPGAAGSAESFLSLLAVGDAAARTAADPWGVAMARRLTVDATHPACGAVIRRSVEAARSRATYRTGRALTRRHIAGIVDAWREGPASKSAAPLASAAVRMAIQSARRAMLPDSLIVRTLDLLRQGEATDPDELIGCAAGPTGDDPVADDQGATVIRVDDALLGESSGPIDDAAWSVWMSGASGLLYDTVSQSWNGCRDSGEIRSASGDGAFLFLDDTASDYAVLNAASFLDDDGMFDVEGFGHAARLLATVQDISLMTAAWPTPRLARRVWDFRPIGLSLAGVGDLLMACGIAYDSDQGRATCAALCALMTGTACLNAARLAAETGPFPAWPDNAAAMQRVVRHHGESVAAIPETAFAGLRDAARDVWQAAAEEGACHGYRNAYLSHIVDAVAESAALGGTTRGVEPVASLIRYEHLPGGGWRRAIAPAVPRGLRALGYGEAEIDRMLRHVLGHGTLDKAAGVNHEALRKRGFTDSAIKAIEVALPTASHIGDVFHAAVLGNAYCRRMLGFTATELEDEAFDMLAALGFSDAGVEAANLYCFGAGTLEGAPYLDPDHLPAFDCATPQGERGRRATAVEAILRMMAAAQPAISGAVGQTLVLPSAAGLADCRDAFRLAWQFGLKSLTARRGEAEPAGGTWRDEGSCPVRTAPHLSLVKNARTLPTMPSDIDQEERASGMSQALAIAHVARALAAHAQPGGAIARNIRTDVAEAGGSAARDAEASRHTASLVTRSTASVPSSADVVVEQRQV